MSNVLLLVHSLIAQNRNWPVNGNEEDARCRLVCQTSHRSRFLVQLKSKYLLDPLTLLLGMLKVKFYYKLDAN
jgi:hypothetical protein